MVPSEKIKILRLPGWTAEAEAGLGESLRDDRDILKAEVDAGRADIFFVSPDTWMLTRLDPVTGKAPELVVCCFRGSRAKEITRLIVERAKARGLSGVRFHTNRKGIPRMVREFGFEFVEAVYQVKF